MLLCQVSQASQVLYWDHVNYHQEGGDREKLINTKCDNEGTSETGRE